MSFGERRHTVTASVGGVQIGSGHPIVVQSMTNTDTADPAATADQVVRSQPRVPSSFGSRSTTSRPRPRFRRSCSA